MSITCANSTPAGTGDGVKGGIYRRKLSPFSESGLRDTAVFLLSSLIKSATLHIQSLSMPAHAAPGCDKERSLLLETVLALSFGRELFQPSMPGAVPTASCHKIN